MSSSADSLAPSNRMPRENTGRPNLAKMSADGIVFTVEETLHQLLLFPREERAFVPSVHSGSSRYTEPPGVEDFADPCPLIFARLHREGNVQYRPRPAENRPG